MARALDRARRGDRALGLLRRRLLLRQGIRTGPSRVTFTDPFAHDAVGTPSNVPLHPTQIYLSLNAFVIFLVLQWAYRRRTFDGEVFWLYILLYSITRGIIEIWRGDLVRGFVIPGHPLDFAVHRRCWPRWRPLAMLFYLSRRAARKPEAPCHPERSEGLSSADFVAAPQITHT